MTWPKEVEEHKRRIAEWVKTLGLPDGEDDDVWCPHDREVQRLELEQERRAHRVERKGEWNK